MGPPSGMKCPPFESQSTTTKIVDFLDEDGSWVIKFIVNLSHTSEMGKGCKVPEGLEIGDFVA